MGKAKGKGKVETEGSSRERSISWDDEQTKFMLDWYIEYKKDQHANFIWKSQHHMKCADALNKKFAMGVTSAQVTRHYRHYKENWKIVETALNKSGNGFDAIKCKLTISESEKATLKDRDRRLLSKPIKYFHEMQELFSGSNADGSLAMDQQTCCDVDNKSDSSDDEGLNDISSYARPIDIAAEDSDTLPSPTCADNGSSGTSRAGKKRPRGSKSPSKKQQPKPKNRFTDATEKISNTMDHLVDQLGNPPPPPPVPQFCDPYASLWKRIDALPISTNDKVVVDNED